MGHDMFEEPMKKSRRRDPSLNLKHEGGEINSLPAEKWGKGHQAWTEGDDTGGRSSSFGVERDDYRRSRRESDRYERGTASKEDRERQGHSRNPKADVGREEYEEWRGSQKRGRH